MDGQHEARTSLREALFLMQEKQTCTVWSHLFEEMNDCRRSPPRPWDVKVEMYACVPCSMLALPSTFDRSSAIISTSFVLSMDTIAN